MGIKTGRRQKADSFTRRSTDSREGQEGTPDCAGRQGYRRGLPCITTSPGVSVFSSVNDRAGPGDFQRPLPALTV